MPDPETHRLTFHRHTRADFTDSAAMWADPATTRHIGGTPSIAEESWSRLLRNVGHWAVAGYGFWIIRDRATNRFAGEVGLKEARRGLPGLLEDTPEIGWVLAGWAHGQGFATEAATAALAWNDDRFAWPRTVCIIDPANIASLRVAEKLGYRACGRPTYREKPVILLDRQRPSTEKLSSPKYPSI